GDAAPEIIVLLPDQKGVEIRGQAGNRLTRIITDYYVTDFGVVPSANGAKQDILIYLYPDEAGGGTFLVMTAEQREVARWRESPVVPGRFTIASWKTRPAVFYLQGDALVARSPAGEPITRLSTAAQGHVFRD